MTTPTIFTDRIGRRKLLAALKRFETSDVDVTVSTALRADGGDDEELTPLEPTATYFAVYTGTGTEPNAFQYPDGPTDFRGFDPGGVLFDTSALLKTHDGTVLHYDFHFTPDNSIVGSKRPYVLVHEGDGQYHSRGQLAEFDVEETPPLFEFLTPGTWRAVGFDIVQLHEKGGQFDWAATRVDFYRLDGDHPEYAVSLVYLLWSDEFGSEVRDPENPQRDAPQLVVDVGRTLVERGPRTTAPPIERDGDESRVEEDCYGGD
ncbi:hypothetical protein SAMN04487950_3982 [Halogranum rubrum]|uniref:Uncharacterized protein n=1 Tax=Halogranum rubrum TaxID=553466 RepID=A0A1I4I679_9EURY|nr:hypothetical protein [Halogranum rubrum]SFL49587.1 hypothetical protein SAMN04487950_3982 [Halogranum rubrum]